MSNPLDSFNSIISETERAYINRRSVRKYQIDRKVGRAPRHVIYENKVFYIIADLPADEQELARDAVRARRLNEAGRIVACFRGVGDQ